MALALSRKSKQFVRLSFNGVTADVTTIIRGSRCVLFIDAPPEVHVVRGEVINEDKAPEGSETPSNAGT